MFKTRTYNAEAEWSDGTSALKPLPKLGISRETTGRNYGRIYAYDKYLKILNERTEAVD